MSSDLEVFYFIFFFLSYKNSNSISTTISDNDYKLKKQPSYKWYCMN